MMTRAKIEATTRARVPTTTPTTIAVIWELLAGELPPPPLPVGMGVLVLALCEFVDMASDCEVAGVGTKVLIGEEDGEGAV